MIQPLKQSFLRTFVVDVLLFVLLLIIGTQAKIRVAQFLLSFDTYKAQIQALEPALANQSTAALSTLEPMVAQLSGVVTIMYYVIVYVLPAVLFLLLALSQTLSLSLVSGKVKGKNFLFGILLMLPFLLLFYLLENFVAAQLVGIGGATWSLTWFIVTLILVFIAAYIWYTVLVQRVVAGKVDVSLLYQKFVRLFPVFFLFALLLFLLFCGIAVIGLSLLTDAFSVTSILTSALVMLGGIALLQVLRYWFVRAVVHR